jgi:predicted AAA+ superfamily ATPase
MFQRLLSPIKSNSFFLFGARGTGKSTFLKEFFRAESTLWIDLLDPLQEDLFARNPGELTAQTQAKGKKLSWVVLDEVQKVPRLLNVVHQLIENTPLRFALTGSSARKLKRGAANLLAGRAFVNHLYPLVHSEMGEQFDLQSALQWGTLPKISQFTTDVEKREYLKSYTLTYLKEEIGAEQIVRKLDPFRRFLPIAAQCSGEVLNFSNIAKDVGADPKTVQSYFEILEDTLIGYLLPPYHRSVRKQQRQSAKFYFFDLGIKGALDGSMVQQPIPNTYGYGKLFEQWLILELLRLNDYWKKDFRFYYLLTKDHAEIDLIIERPGLPIALVEIKSSEQVDERDTRILERFLPDFKKAELFCLSRDPHPKKIGNVQALPWKTGIQSVLQTDNDHSNQLPSKGPR